MTTLRSYMGAKFFGCILFCTVALTAHARDWIINGVSPAANTPAGVGMWMGPEWGVTGSYSSLQAGDTFIFSTDISASTANQFNTGVNTKSLSFKSNNGEWRTIKNTGNLANTRIFQFQQGNNTYNFDHIIISGGTTTGNGQFGAGISFSAGAAGTNTITGELILQNNTVLGSANQNFGGAINLNTLAGSYLAVSATITFRNNLAATTAAAGSAQGGAINIAGNALGAEFTGVTLFESNTTTSGNIVQGNGGAYFVAAAGTSISTFANHTTFKNNYAYNSGGAIGTVKTTTLSPGLVITGYSYFDGNKTSDGVSGGGGAIYWNGDLSISGSSTFTSNTSGYLGGAIYLANTNTHSLSLSLDASEGNITFINNQHMAATTAERNAIVIGTLAGQNYVPTVTLNSGSVAGNHAIYFFDPIKVSDTSAAANIHITGSNVVVFDGLHGIANMITGTTTVESGAMALTRGAVYGTGSSIGDFVVTTGAKLSANGTVRANTITLADGAHLEVNGNGTIRLAATTLNTGSNLVLSGHGIIDIAKGLDVALIDVGTLISADPSISATVTNFAQTLTIGASSPITLQDGGTIQIELFAGNLSDLLIVDSLTMSGSGYINLIGTGDGRYKVISSAHDIAASTSINLMPLVNGVAPAGHFGAVKQYESGGTELWINFTTQNLTTRWTGSAGGIWNHVPGSDLNWNDGEIVTPDSTFLNGDRVIFDDFATNKTVTIEAAGVVVADMAVNSTVGNDYIFAGSGGITASTTNSIGSIVGVATGKLTKKGSGAINFANTAPNTFTGGMEIEAGEIGFTAANQLGDGGKGIHFKGDGALRANANNLMLSNIIKVDAHKTASLHTGPHTLTYAGVLNMDATGTLAKTGAGILKLTTDNSANLGSTVIKEGFLSLDTAGAALGGRIDVSDGATLAGSGSATGSVYAGSGAIIHPGALSSVGPVTLHINNLDLNSATLRFNLFATGTNDRINLSGGLTIAGTNKIDIQTFQSGTFNLGNLGELNGTEVTIGGFLQGSGARQKAVVTGTSGFDLFLVTQADISRIITWTGATSGTWNPANNNWTDGGTVTLYANGDRIIFDDTAVAAPTHDISIAGSGMLVSDMLVQGTSNYAFSGAGITADPASVISGTVITSGTGKLIKTGSGTLAFKNAGNNFKGGIEIGGGAITFNNANQLGDGGNGIFFSGDAAIVSLNDAQTLSNNITIAAGRTGVIDAGAHNITLSGILRASDGPGTLSKVGSGTLTLTGNSMGTGNLTAQIKEGALLFSNIIFTGTMDMGANTTLIGTGTLGSIRAESHSTVRVNNGILDVGNFNLAGSSTLNGAGEIKGSATLDGLVYANVATDQLTLSGTVKGGGGFVKSGTGTLAYASINALGNTGTTQIDEGVINFSGASGASTSSVRQTIILNSGTLRLNDTTSATAGAENSATDWTNIIFGQGTGAHANTGRIIGGTNDIIKLGSGTMGFEMRNGLHVVVDAGAGSTVFTSTNNNFGGVVRIDSGTFQIVDSRAIGTLGAGTTTKVVLNGGILQLSSTMMTTRSIEMRTTSGVVAVDDAVSATWGSVTKTSTDAGTFTKIGKGTLVISGTNGANSINIAEGRYTTRSAAGAGTALVTIADGATFEYSATNTISGTIGFVGTNVAGLSLVQQATHENGADNALSTRKFGFVAGKPITPSDTIASQFTGSGTLAVTNGHLVFSSTKIDIPHIEISGANAAVIVSGINQNIPFATNSTISVNHGGMLVLGAEEQTIGNVVLSNTGAVAFLMNAKMVYTATTVTTMVSGSIVITNTTVPVGIHTYGQGFKKATLAGLSGDGVLRFNTNFELGRADHLTVNTPISGTFAIGMNNYGWVPEHYFSAMELISAPESNNATFLAPNKIDIGLYSYALSSTSSGGKMSLVISGTGAMSNSAAIINSMVGALPLSWFSELTSVSQRMGDLHLENRDGKGGISTWVRSHGQQLDFKTKVNGLAFDERQLAVEGGADYKFGGSKYNFYIGGFFGYGDIQRNYNVAGDGSSESYFGGLYETFSTKSGWYLDGVLKLNGFKSEYTAISPTGESMTGEFHNWAVGGSLELGKFWTLPFGWFIEPQVQGAFTAIMDSHYLTSSGMQVDLRSGTTTQGRIGFRFGRIYKTGKNGVLHIYIKGYGAAQWTTNGQLYVVAPSGQNRRYTPTIKGDRIEVGGGIAWRANEYMQYYFDFETADAAYYIKPWGINFGIRRSW